jgi:hypothetical protein
MDALKGICVYVYKNFFASGNLKSHVNNIKVIVNLNSYMFIGLF